MAVLLRQTAVMARTKAGEVKAANAERDKAQRRLVGRVERWDMVPHSVCIIPTIHRQERNRTDLRFTPWTVRNLRQIHLR